MASKTATGRVPQKKVGWKTFSAEKKLAEKFSAEFFSAEIFSAEIFRRKTNDDKSSWGGKAPPRPPCLN